MTARTFDRAAARHRTRMTAVVAACLLFAPAVAGCSINPVESVIEGVTGGNVDIGGTSVPDDFPSEVPLIDGEVIGAFAVGSGAEKVWTVTMKVDDASATDAIKAELEAAGFTSEVDQGVGGIAGAAYKNANFGVLVVVAEDGNGGWAANYTVTPAG